MKTIEQLEDEIKKLNHELLMVSKLASDKAEFYSPINAMLAQKTRDRVLRNNGY